MLAPSDDIDHLMTIMNAAFDPYYNEAWTRRQIEDALLIGRCHYKIITPDGNICTDNNTPAGFFLSKTGFEEEELLLFAVIPEYRSRGLGRILLTWLSNDAKKRGAEKLFLEMRRGNTAANLYSRFGFETIGERPKYYHTTDGKRIDAITYVYNLKF